MLCTIGKWATKEGWIRGRRKSPHLDVLLTMSTRGCESKVGDLSLAIAHDADQLGLIGDSGAQRTNRVGMRVAWNGHRAPLYP